MAVPAGGTPALRPFQHRARLQRIIRFATVALLTAAAAIDLGLILGTAPSFAFGVTVLGTFLAPALALAEATSPPAAAVARDIDARFHLHDRVASALQFASHGDPFSALVRADAERALATLEPDAAYPIRPPRALLTALLVALVLPVLLVSAGSRSFIATTRDAGNGVADQTVQAPTAQSSTSGAPASRDETPHRPASPATAAHASPAEPGQPHAAAVDGGHPGGTAADAGLGEQAAVAAGAGTNRGSGPGAGGSSNAAEQRDAGGVGQAPTGDARTNAATAPTAEYAQAYRKGAAAMESALATGRVPVRWRGYVREYFAAVRPEQR